MIFKGVATMSWALFVYYGYKRTQKPFNFSTQLLEKPMKWWTTMISPFFLKRLTTKHSSWLYKILWLLKSFTRLQGWFMNLWILTLDLRNRTGRLATIHQWVQGMQEMLTLALMWPQSSRLSFLIIPWISILLKGVIASLYIAKYFDMDCPRVQLLLLFYRIFYCLQVPILLLCMPSFC